MAYDPPTADRRGFLGACLAAAGAAMTGAASEAAAIEAGAASGAYERLGLRPLINAAGIRTMLGGSLILPEVTRAMESAGRQYVNLRELHDAAGKRIARAIGVGAALVTSGAAAALTLGTAACVTKGDPARIRQIPDITGLADVVLIQPTHRHAFDHAIRNVGVRFVEVETREDLDRAIASIGVSKIAMMHFLVYEDRRGRIGMQEWIAAGRQHGIPNLLDAAADIPPAGNLRRYVDMGFDLVAFSGGKALRGPQCSGLLLGRRDLVDWAFLNDSPFSDTIGRGCKVGKEEIVGLLTAVELYLRRDHAADMRRWQNIVDGWQRELTGVTGVTVTRSGPVNAGNVPYLGLEWDAASARPTRDRFITLLRDGDPRIELWDTEPERLHLTPFMLEPGEHAVVIRRVVQALGRS